MSYSCFRQLPLISRFYFIFIYTILLSLLSAIISVIILLFYHATFIIHFDKSVYRFKYQPPLAEIPIFSF